MAFLHPHVFVACPVRFSHGELGYGHTVFMLVFLSVSAFLKLFWF
jgi:hypothetical protein